MNRLYFKQKRLSFAERFTIFDEAEDPRYFVEGSFLRVPKSFRIIDTDDHEIARITKKPSPCSRRSSSRSTATQKVVVALVIAIDRILATRDAGANSAAM